MRAAKWMSSEWNSSGDSSFAEEGLLPGTIGTREEVGEPGWLVQGSQMGQDGRKEFPE